jgi:hypothetical protein
LVRGDAPTGITASPGGYGVSDTLPGLLGGFGDTTLFVDAVCGGTASSRKPDSNSLIFMPLFRTRGTFLPLV